MATRDSRILPAEGLARPAPGEEGIVPLHSSFLANVSHEFRTPLSALNASVEYLLDELDHLSKDELRELLRSIHLSVTGLQALIENLLESSSIQAGRFTIRLQQIDLCRVIVEALQVVGPLLDRRQQDTALDLPDCLAPVWGDHTRLKQVMVNLLSNASKYGPMDQTIEVSLSPLPGGWVQVSVADRGPGIPPQAREKLFVPFARVGDPGGAQYGVGLGLSVVKAIIDEHKGEIGQTPRRGGGSIFWFTVRSWEGINESADCG